uniref:Truncated TcdC n=1 Tax=Clostridioides difficile TaxID=1496 RepID=A7UJ27_CLODI|nr:truncated TcdC [Clostridioides difficile]
MFSKKMRVTNLVMKEKEALRK